MMIGILKIHGSADSEGHLIKHLKQIIITYNITYFTLKDFTLIF